MIPQHRRPDRAELQLELPEAEASSAGYVFFPQKDRWVLLELNNRFTMSFEHLPGLHPSLKTPLKLTLCWFVKNRSASYAKEILKKFKNLFAHASITTGLPVIKLTGMDLMNFRAELGERKEWKLGSLAAAIKKWHALGYPGIEDDAIAYFDAVSIKGNERGLAVATLHPVRGPLTDIEYDALCQAIRSSLAASLLALADRVAIWLCLVLGPRTIQIAALKVPDLRTSRGKDGSVHYVLMVPDVKQRRPIRTSYRPRLLPDFIGELVVEQAEAVRKAWLAQGMDPATAPLLPRWMSTRVDRYEGQGHYTSRQLSARVIRALRKVAPYSERTGARLQVSPSRLRFTMGTRAAAEGLSDAVIAWLLGHSNTQHVGVYRGLADALALHISHTMSLALAPLARAFQGTIVEPGLSGSFNIVDPRFDETMEHPIGSCVACGPCDLGAPIDCYVCTQFRAWRDGPHEAVHDFLRAERDRLAKTCGERLAAANDLVIKAVAEVVQKCRAATGTEN